MKIKIDHIAKIEGHAGFVADIAQGNVIKARLDIAEGARLLEGILQGRSYNEVSQITARICGVCPVVHTLTSLKALEAAMDVFVPPQIVLLRELMMMGQILNSHALHLFFFSLSDFFGIKNDLRLIKKYPQKAKDALLLRDFGNALIDVIGGRSIHPLTPEVGGFKKFPTHKRLKELEEKSQRAISAAERLAKFFGQLKYPAFERNCQFVCLSFPGHYAIYDGEVKSGKSLETASDFMPKIQETQIRGSAVKRSQYGDSLYMVGALSRLNYNAKNLNQRAKAIFRETDLVLPSSNPFHNVLAQAIEMVHCVEESYKLLKKAEALDFEIDPQPFEIKAGKGYAAMEAPRGTLFYYYEVDEEGFIKNANIVTPTSQNLARLEEDLKEYLPSLIGKKDICQKECEEKIKMLVRAYDPCLTCATH
ncbi:MAG: Ni/Fe hydrogenase subunit alpha [Candidatus Portnoybacteria bacterium]|nr:Ni/Fe hydrogenase subunit alpha [Candidatus Portnoybacteria bacterium]